MIRLDLEATVPPPPNEPFDYDSIDRRHLIEVVASRIYEEAAANDPVEPGFIVHDHYDDPVSAMLYSESFRSIRMPPRAIAKHFAQLSRIRFKSNECFVKMLFYIDELAEANIERNAYAEDGRDAFTLNSKTVRLFLVVLTVIATRSSGFSYTDANELREDRPRPYYAELAKWARLTEMELYDIEMDLAMSDYYEQPFYVVLKMDLRNCAKKYFG